MVILDVPYSPVIHPTPIRQSNCDDDLMAMTRYSSFIVANQLYMSGPRLRLTAAHRAPRWGRAPRWVLFDYEGIIFWVLIFYRLMGDRGLTILPQTFESLKFKGKGHEVSDLNTLMSAYEHWAHRLFPKMPFDEVVERLEKLGQKREVQVCSYPGTRWPEITASAGG